MNLENVARLKAMLAENYDPLKFKPARLQEDDDIFKLRVEKLKGGSATESESSGPLQTINEAAVTLTVEIAERLRNDQLTPLMLELLANHLEQFTEQQSLAFFSLNKANRHNTSAGQKQSAIDAFSDALRKAYANKEIFDESSALIQAYDAFFATGSEPEGGLLKRTYAADLKKPTPRNARHPNVALGTMESTIRPNLVIAGLLPEPKARLKKVAIDAINDAFSDALGQATARGEVFDEASALIKSYDAFFATGPAPSRGQKRRTYAADLKRPPPSDVRQPNNARAMMESTIRPVLVKAGLLPEPKAR